MRRLMLLPMALLLLGSPAFAQEDEEGCKDHPNIPRFPGYALTSCKLNDFEKVELATGDDKYEHPEGRFWELGYELKEGSRTPSATELIRNYENAVKKLGGKKIYSNDTMATYSMPLGKAKRWFQLETFNSVTSVVFKIVEEKEMVQTVEMTAGAMLDELNKKGVVVLHINFDTNKDTIKPDAEPQLAEIASLLTANASLRLSVEGHTDNVGNAKANMDLSRRRAESVKKYLVDKGIDGKRLETQGFGDTRRVGDNSTEEGRKANRRVELKKLK